MEQVRPMTIITRPSEKLIKLMSHLKERKAERVKQLKVKESCTLKIYV